MAGRCCRAGSVGDVDSGRGLRRRLRPGRVPVGGTDPRGDASFGRAQDSAAPPARHLPTVVIDKAVNVVTFDVADIAAHEGFFAQRCVAPKLDVVAGSTVANSSVTGGSAQFSLAGSLPFLLARSKGLPRISVGALDERVGLELTVSSRWLAGACPKLCVAPSNRRAPAGGRPAARTARPSA